MIRIDGLIEVLGMAGGALRGCTGITCCMTRGTIHIEVTSGQGEVRQRMVKDIFGISSRMAGQTGGAVI